MNRCLLFFSISLMLLGSVLARPQAVPAQAGLPSTAWMCNSFDPLPVTRVTVEVRATSPRPGLAPRLKITDLRIAFDEAAFLASNTQDFTRERTR